MYKELNKNSAFIMTSYESPFFEHIYSAGDSRMRPYGWNDVSFRLIVAKWNQQ